MKKQVAIFVDAGYFFAQSSETLFGRSLPRHEISLNEQLIINILKNKAKDIYPTRELLRIYWYDAPPSLNTMSSGQIKIASLPCVKLRMGTLNGNGQQKGVDALICRDIEQLARNSAIDRMILLAGDEDLRLAMEDAQSYGVQATILVIGSGHANVGMSLAQESDGLTYLTKSEIIEAVYLKNKNENNHKTEHTKSNNSHSENTNTVTDSSDRKFDHNRNTKNFDNNYHSKNKKHTRKDKHHRTKPYQDRNDRKYPQNHLVDSQSTNTQNNEHLEIFNPINNDLIAFDENFQKQTAFEALLENEALLLIQNITKAKNEISISESQTTINKPTSHIVQSSVPGVYTLVEDNVDVKETDEKTNIDQSDISVFNHPLPDTSISLENNTSVNPIDEALAEALNAVANKYSNTQKTNNELENQSNTVEIMDDQDANSSNQIKVLSVNDNPNSTSTVISDLAANISTNKENLVSASEPIKKRGRKPKQKVEETISNTVDNIKDIGDSRVAKKSSTKSKKSTQVSKSNELNSQQTNDTGVDKIKLTRKTLKEVSTTDNTSSNQTDTENKVKIVRKKKIINKDGE